MAGRQHTTLPEGIKRQDYWHGIIYEGNKDALIASGIARRDWFADGFEQDKRGRIKRGRAVIVDGQEISTKSPPVGAAQVWIRYPEDVAEARWEREQEERDRKLAEEYIGGNRRLRVSSMGSDVAVSTEHGIVTVYSGRKDALIAAGICGTEEFPKAPTWSMHGDRVIVWRRYERGRGTHYQVRDTLQFNLARARSPYITEIGKLEMARQDARFRRFMLNIVPSA